MHNIYLLIIWIILILVFPIIISYVVGCIVQIGRNVENSLGYYKWSNDFTERIATVYHELAHAFVGLFFLCIPYKFNFWNNKKKESINSFGLSTTPQGYVKQISIGYVGHILGMYFISAAPILLMLILIVWIFTGITSHDFLIENLNSIPEIFRPKMICSNIIIAAKYNITNISTLILQNKLSIAFTGVTIGFFIRGSRLSVSDIIGSLLGILSVTIICGLIIYIIYFYPATYFTSLLNNIFHINSKNGSGVICVTSGLLTRITVLEIYSFILCIFFILLHFVSILICIFILRLFTKSHKRKYAGTF